MVGVAGSTPVAPTTTFQAEYQIHYSQRDGVFYFKGYAIEVERVPAVQLQILGNEDGPVDDTAEERYSAVSYQLIYGGLVELVVAELNTDSSMKTWRPAKPSGRLL